MNQSSSSCRTIWLVRHAQSTANRDQIIQGHLDTELTDTGLQQAYFTGQYFKQKASEFNIKHLYSSDLQRTILTAQFIGDNLNLETVQEPELREAFFGKWEGAHSPTLAVDDALNYTRWMQNRKWRPEWCESFEALQARGVQAINKIISETQDDVIIVTHGGIIFSFILYYTQAFGETPSSNNCGITTLKVATENGKPQITVSEVNFVGPFVPITTLQLSTNEEEAALPIN
jgi:broad specificity phosphatase PhoE